MEGIENISHLDKYDKLRVAKRPRHLQTPQVPPSLAQCLQYLQFLHALQLPEPVQVAVFAGMLADKQVRENAISIRKAGIFFIFSFCHITHSLHQMQAIAGIYWLNSPLDYRCAVWHKRLVAHNRKRDAGVP